MTWLLLIRLFKLTLSLFYLVVYYIIFIKIERIMLADLCIMSQNHDVVFISSEDRHEEVLKSCLNAADWFL